MQKGLILPHSLQAHELWLQLGSWAFDLLHLCCHTFSKLNACIS